MPKSYQMQNNNSIDISLNILGANGKPKIYKGTVCNEKPVVDYLTNNNNRWIG